MGRALITGGSGFTGSYLVVALLEREYEVTVIDNLSTGQLENIAHLTDHPPVDSVANEMVMD